MSYQVIATVDEGVTELHAVFKAKLKHYGFKKVADKKYVLVNKVEDLFGVLFYKKNIENAISPLHITGRSAEETEHA